MQQTLRCPGCDAELVLPASAANQTVQCPRCRRVFRGSTSKMPMPTTPSLPLPSPAEDHDQFEPTPVIVPRGELTGWWLAVPVMVLIAATVVPFSMWAYVWYERIEFRGQGNAGQVAFRDNKRFSNEVEFWVQATSWPAYAAFAVWSALAARNSRLLQAIGLLPAFTLILCFSCCPLLNAVIAYINLQDVWRSSDPHEIEKPESWRRIRPSPWIRAWGLMLASSPVLVFSAFRFDRMGDFLASSILLILANLSLAAANILLVAIIANITIRQRQRFINLYEDPA